MMKIKIHNLHLRVKVGTFDYEQENPQEILAQIEIGLESNQSTKTDQLDDTVDYFELSKQLIHIVENRTYQLLEKLAGDIAQFILEKPGIKSCKIEVKKLRALPWADGVSVCLEL